MNAVLWAALCWLLIWAVGRYFNERAKRKKFRDERDGLK